MSTSIRVQIVLYNNAIDELRRLSSGIGAALRHSIGAGAITSAELAFGDSSTVPSLTDTQVAELADLVDPTGSTPVRYHFFDANLGSGGGSRRLMDGSRADVIWVLNPDTVPAPSALTHLLDVLVLDGVAAVDAKQIPIESPKGYDPGTGEAAWVSGACVVLRRDAAESVGGFDPHFFPMYCDDVDISWRLRLAGWTVRHQPLATVFHDKRLGSDGRPTASEFEHESGVLSRLFLAHRYGRPDIVDDTLAWVDARGHDPHRRAAATYRRRRDAGDVPEPLDGAAAVADLDADAYGPARLQY